MILLDQYHLYWSLSLSLSIPPPLSLFFSLNAIVRIDANLVIKVAHLGLAESIGDEEYFRQDKDSPVRLPLKWLALETITDYIFSEKTDVVSCNPAAVYIQLYWDHMMCPDQWCS